MKPRIVVAAGGTGGHIFPGIAVVEAIKQQTGGDSAVHFVGSESRMESTLIPSMGYTFSPLPIEPFRGVHWRTLLLPLSIVQSVLRARTILQRFAAQAVICTGAYMSYPAGVAAHQLGIPLFVLESNVNPGKTNRQLAPKSTWFVTAFEQTVHLLPKVVQPKVVCLGNPVRGSIGARPTVAQSKDTLGVPPTMPLVLVFGGSLGARSINSAMERMVTSIAMAQQHGSQPPFAVLWQTGKHYQVPSQFLALPWVIVVEFIDNMAAAYAAASVVVCRSGATTIAELSIAGAAAIVVPLGTASTGEQAKNALVTTNAGATITLTDESVGEQLYSTVCEVIGNETLRNTMQTNIKKFARPNAASDVSTLILRTIEQNTPT
jgi:UDP-N-acetylglucosamine--N-acetylmuramyl-(pentapeptide) pyrophosphoryl-undecaprenol N-acetylglucosamine transferase